MHERGMFIWIRIFSDAVLLTPRMNGKYNELNIKGAYFILHFNFFNFFTLFSILLYILYIHSYKTPREVWD